MRKTIGAVLALALAAANVPATAASDLRQRSSAGVRGRCFRLVLNGRDQTAICRNKVTIIAFADGAIAFLFSARELTIGFAGVEGSISGGDEEARLPVQSVLAGEQNKTLQQAPASGICRFGDMYAGPAVIECSAHSVFGSMAASFVSDGRRPRPS